MHCMKCGKETRESQTFCDSCLAVMLTKPVKPDTVVQLPARPAAPTKKPSSRKRPPTAEEQLARLRKAIKWMGLTIACLALALAVTVCLLLNPKPLDQPEHGIGQNYSTENAGQQAG